MFPLFSSMPVASDADRDKKLRILLRQSGRRMRLKGGKSGSHTRGLLSTGVGGWLINILNEGNNLRRVGYLLDGSREYKAAGFWSGDVLMLNEVRIKRLRCILVRSERSSGARKNTRT